MNHTRIINEQVRIGGWESNINSINVKALRLKKITLCHSTVTLNVNAVDSNVPTKRWRPADYIKK